MVLLFVCREGIRGLPPWLHVAIDSTQAAYSVLACNTEVSQQLDERFHILIVSGPEASVAAAIEGRAQGTASGARHGSEARLTARDHDAYVAAPFAFQAYAVSRESGLRFGQKRAHDGKKLMLVDGTAP